MILFPNGEIMHMHKSKIVFLVLLLVCNTVPVALADQDGSPPVSELTLTVALEMALERSPLLAAAAANLAGHRALTRQAGGLPNPELEVEIGNLTTGGEGGLSGAESTVLVSQLFELGGKRGGRIRIAELNREISAQGYEATRRDVVAETTESFIDLLSAQALAEIHDQTAVIAREVHQAVAARVTAGKVSLLEEDKAVVELAGAEMQRRRSARRMELARSHLAAAWGSSALQFSGARGTLGTLGTIPEASRLDSLLSLGPELARLETEEALGRAQLEYQRALRIPDLSLSGGVVHARDSGENSFKIGLGLPLPLFNRNGEAIRAAGHDLTSIAHIRRVAELAATTGVRVVHQDLISLRAEIQVLEEDGLPAATRAFTAAREGYTRGKFDLLDLLDAQRTLIGTREQRIELLTEYHKTLTELERRIGAWEADDGIHLPEREM
jgi:outer membrane protein, heavy metal efflux system